MKLLWNKRMRELFCLALAAMGVFWVMYGFTGQWPNTPNPYNSYSLQAESWLEGRLDLGRNYEHLELAVYHGRYYVSFPPFPSYVMLPFAALYGSQTPDGWIALAVGLMGAVYAMKLFWLVRRSDANGFFWVMFLTMGTNLLFIKLNGWVWFMAQNMCFTLSIMALYYAKKKSPALSLAFWACSVGCRPFQAIYFPVLLWILYSEIKTEHPDWTWKKMLGKYWISLIPMIILALSYMILNYIRFGSITEFGHNYLPEFLEAEKGQFDVRYIGENVRNLFRLPRMWEEGRLDFYNFNGFAFWLASPIFASWFFYFIRRIFVSFRKYGGTTEIKMGITAAILAAIHTMLFLSHKTMGGWHFGNRYLNDLLPYIFYSMLLLIPERDKWIRIQYGLFLLGLSLNLVGSIALYNYWIM